MLFIAYLTLPLISCASLLTGDEVAAKDPANHDSSDPKLPERLEKKLSLSGFKRLPPSKDLEVFECDPFPDVLQALKFVYNQAQTHLKSSSPLYDEIMKIVYEEAASLAQTSPRSFTALEQITKGNFDWTEALWHFIETDNLDGFMNLASIAKPAMSEAQPFRLFSQQTTLFKTAERFERAIPVFARYFRGNENAALFWSLFDEHTYADGMLLMIVCDLPRSFLDYWLESNSSKDSGHLFGGAIIALLLNTLGPMASAAKDPTFPDKLADVIEYVKRFYVRNLPSPKASLFKWTWKDSKSSERTTNLKIVNALQFLLCHRYPNLDGGPRAGCPEKYEASLSILDEYLGPVSDLGKKYVAEMNSQSR